jgi:hypothetical protein
MREPEITLNTELGKNIISFIRDNNIKSVIEIGSGAGNGSTQCFLAALLENPFDSKLYCFEPNIKNYVNLLNFTKIYPWCKCYNNSAISYSDFIVKDYDKDFWESQYNFFKTDISLKDMVKTWYDGDISFFKNEPFSILPNISAECVLIDGCEFSGYSEYKQLHPDIKHIILDDCLTAFKNIQVYSELNIHPNWKLVNQGSERNGWAIFSKVN